MYVLDDKLILSPSDLNGFVECRHLTRLDLARARGELDDTPQRDPIADLLSAKGMEHERAYLERLRAEGREVVEIADPDHGRDLDALRARADETAAAMRSGAEVIFQATFFQPVARDERGRGLSPFRGHADFLFRRDDRPSELGPWSYEVADAKLARRAKPYFLIQLCFYSDLLEAIQGGESPEHVHVVLGTGELESFRLAEFSAYFRRVRERFMAALEGEADTYPEPCGHCQVCGWRSRCDAQREADDHLSLVAGIRRRHRDLLSAAGTRTLAGLAALGEGADVPGIRGEQLTKLRSQAALQLRTRTSGAPALELLEPADRRGFSRLPRPSPGDVFFDLEGDPFYEDGLEYLFGYVTADGDEPRFTALWGRDRAEEGRTLERFIDFVGERRRRWPDLHVYHYAPYELTALKRLAGMHGTREAELDQLLRDEVFVDLHKVVREAMRLGQPSYGLKKVEAYYMEQRDTAVTDGNQSVIEFERWLEQGGLDGGPQEILDQIADYNRDDCLSTLRLRDWLLARRAECERARGIELGWFEHEAAKPSEEAQELAGETERLIAALGEGIPEQASERDPAQAARWLLAQLLDYHRREARPVWWMFFERSDGELDDLVDDADCVGGLEPDPDHPPYPEKRSMAHPMRFPPQETKLGVGAQPCDPETRDGAGTILEIEPEQGRLTLKRGPKLADVPLPRGLIPGSPYDTRQQRGALRRLASAVADAATHPEGEGEGEGPVAARYSACLDLLHRRPPRVRGLEPGAPLHEGPPEIDRLRALVSAMDDTYLAIQGPPGSGKTWTGARLVTHLIREDNRVGVAAPSHRAIENLLREVEAVAGVEGLRFRGLKKHSDNSDSTYEGEQISSVGDNSALTDPDLNLAAGTAWHFCREEVDGTLDYLFIDEAGQLSLADALALGTAARNVVLLGDPQQLPQVSQARHPAGASLSALEHLLGDRQTIPPTEGVFLECTYRMHPDLTAPVSELMYDGRLRSAPGRERQRIVADGALAGAGLRWVPVEHDGNAQSSPEEAEAIAAMLAGLEGATYIDAGGDEHPLTREDVLVITPYNAQVRCLSERLPPGTRIGTVDRFQGQQAEAVFFSLATSSGVEIPRGLEFLLNRNRLNVAISRARCLSVVVASPALLEIDCRTIEQMRLVNALCRVVEVG